MHNNVNHAIKIVTHHRLGCITELPYKSCFAISRELDTASILPTLPAIFYNHNGICILLAGNLKTDLGNGNKIYGDEDVVNAITCLVDEYLSI